MAKKNTDTVPAMLTPGEVVLNAKQQKRLGEHFGMSAAEVFKKIGVPGFQLGGKVDTLKTKKPKPYKLVQESSFKTAGFDEAKAKIDSSFKATKEMSFEDRIKAYKAKKAKAGVKPKNLQAGGIANTPIVGKQKIRRSPFLAQMRELVKMSKGGKVGSSKRSDIYRGIYLAKMRNR
jgi:hypothetical protein